MEWLHLLKLLEKVKRFSGEEIVVSNDGFAFSKEMESRCGWLDRYASIQMLTGDTPISVRYMFDHQEEFQIGERHSQDK